MRSLELLVYPRERGQEVRREDKKRKMREKDSKVLGTTQSGDPISSLLSPFREVSTPTCVRVSEFLEEEPKF
jgi:hypothetical protein